MADVSPVFARRETDRGQLLLLTGLGLAALLVMLALVLNAVIYTENVATRDSAGGETIDVGRYESTVLDTTRTIIIAENGIQNPTFTDKVANLSTQLADWSNLSALHGAGDATVRTVTLNETVKGTRLTQQSVTQVTNGGGAGNWTMAESTGGIGHFTLAVNRSALVHISDPNPTAADLENESVFSITFANTSETDTVFIYDYGGITLRTESSDGTNSTCAAADTVAVIGFVNATLDGSRCAALEGPATLTDGVTIRFSNGHSVTGAYTVVIVGDPKDPSIGFATTPSSEPIIYEATVDIQYLAPGITYENVDVRVSGGSWP